MLLRSLGLVVTLASLSVAQPPDLLGYDFDTSIPGPPITIINNAVPGVGSAAPALVTNQLITSGSLCPAARSPALTTTSGVDRGFSTGWNADLGTASWTVGMKLDLRAGLVQGVPTPNYFQYLLGQSTGGAFRAFVDGMAGDGNVVLRGPFADTIIPGGGSQYAPVFICWVYDSALGQIRGYLNGTLAVTTAQTPITLAGTDALVVGGYVPGSSPLQPGVKMDDFRFYGRAITPSEIASWNGCTIGLAWQTVQMNSPNASLSLDGVAGSTTAAATVQKCPGSLTSLHLGSALPAGTWFDVAIASGTALVPGVNFSGQIVNLDLGVAPVWLSNGQAGPPVPLPPLAWPGVWLRLPFFAPAVASTFHTQGYFLDPTVGPGVSLTAPAEMTVSSFTPVILADDTSTQINLAQLCPTMTSISFYGTSYSSFFVNSNGSISFGAGDPSPICSPAALAAGPPRAAPLWADLDPWSGGHVNIYPMPGNLAVRWESVPEHGTGNANSFTVVFGANGSTMFHVYALAAGFSHSSLVGITPGATRPSTLVPVNFEALIGTGLHTGAVTDSVYQSMPGTAVPGLGTTISAIAFPFSDGSGFLVL